MIDYSININGHLLSLRHPQIMAIVNATNDSFAFSCTNICEAEILAMTAKAVAEGADIIDVGACSTRPNSTPISEEEEWRRLTIALKAIRCGYADLTLSLDTFRASIARRAVEQFRVDIINDISGGADKEMFATVADLGVPYILTHNAPLNTDIPVSVQVLNFLVRKADELHRLGVKDVIADPGFGFNKTETQNYELLTHLADLRYAQLPLLVGLSRKSMFYKPLNTTPDSDVALAATIAANTIALQAGASILRVHDVEAAKAAITVIEKTI